MAGCSGWARIPGSQGLLRPKRSTKTYSNRHWRLCLHQSPGPPLNARGRGSRAVTNRQNSAAAASHRRPGAGTSSQHHLVMRFHGPKAVTVPARLRSRKAVASGGAGLWMLVKRSPQKKEESYLKSRRGLIHGSARTQLLSFFSLFGHPQSAAARAVKCPVHVSDQNVGMGKR